MYYLDAAQIEPEDELIYTRLPDELVNRSEVKSYLEQAREVIELKAIYLEVCINDKED